MTDLIDELLEPRARPAKEAAVRKPTIDDPVADLLSPQTELRQATRPPGRGLVEDYNLAAPNWMIARASLAPNVDDQIKRYAEHFGVPISYFGVMDGEIVRWVPEENAFAKVVPTISGQETIAGKVLGGAAQVAAGVGPTLPSVAGGVAGSMMGPTPASIPAAGGAAFFTDWARQILDKMLAGEPLNPFDGANYDYHNMAGHAVLAAGGQAIAVGVNRALTRNPLGVEAYERLAAADRIDQAKWMALDAEAKSRGVNLTTAQKTGLRSLLAKERQLSRFNETADLMYAKKMEQWQGEIPKAYYDEIAKTHPVFGREEMIRSFREGAEDVVEQALATRAKGAQAAYGKAYAEYPAIDSAPLRNIWDRLERAGAINEARKIADARGELLGPVDAELTQYAREAAKAGKMEFPKGGVAKGLSLQTWDRVKRGLWAQIENNVDPQTGKLNQLGAAYKSLWDDLVGELDKLTGGPTGSYAAARVAYGEGSEVVDQVLKGGIGFIQRMKGPERVDMVTRVFSGKNILPEEIARMRASFIGAGHEEAWKSGLSAHLANVLDDVQKASGMSGNIPGNLFTRLSRDQLQHDSIVAAMGKQEAKSFESFLNVLHAASRSLPEGSPTATDLAAGPGTVSKGLKVIGKILSPKTYWEAGDQVIEGLEAMRTPAARIKLAEHLLSDKGMEELKKFRMPSKITQQTIIWLGQVFQQAGIIGTGIRKPADFEPPITKELPVLEGGQ